MSYSEIASPDEGIFVSSAELHKRGSLLEAFARGETKLSIGYWRRFPDGSAHLARNLSGMSLSSSGREAVPHKYSYIVEAGNFVS